MADSGAQTVTPGSLTGDIVNDKQANFSKLNSKIVRPSSLFLRSSFLVVI